MENDQSFWQFSDKLRLQSTGGGGVNEFSGNRWAAFNPTHFSKNFSNLSMNDNSIWSTGSYDRKKENLESRINQEPKGKNTEMMMMNNVNMGWKFSAGMSSNGGGGKNSVQGGRMNENPKVNKQNNSNGNGKNAKGGNSVDKRFKTLPPSESLPHGVPLGGYIFVCNNDTMEDDLRRLLFGLPQRYRDSVRAITPGLPLFLYNYSTHQLHGIFQAASFGGTNIDPSAWEDKKCPGESRFPAQVRVETRKACPPLEEDSFRPVLHHYDGPKFRLQLSIPEALSLLDIFEEKSKLATPPLYVS